MKNTKNLTSFNGKLVCPRCDGNGLIYKGKIVERNLTVYICDECEAAWEDFSNIAGNTFTDLTILLEEKGCASEEIEDLGYVKL